MRLLPPIAVLLLAIAATAIPGYPDVYVEDAVVDGFTLKVGARARDVATPIIGDCSPSYATELSFSNAIMTINKLGGEYGACPTAQVEPCIGRGNQDPSAGACKPQGQPLP